MKSNKNMTQFAHLSMRFIVFLIYMSVYTHEDWQGTYSTVQYTAGQFSSKLDVKRFDKVKLCPLVG